MAARPFVPRALEHQPLCSPAWGREVPEEITPQGWLLGALGWDRTSHGCCSGRLRSAGLLGIAQGRRNPALNTSFVQHTPPGTHHAHRFGKANLQCVFLNCHQMILKLIVKL